MALLFLIIIILLVIKIQDKLYQKYTFRNLTYKCYFSKEEAFEGDEIELIEEFSNAKLLPIPWIKSDFTTSKWLDFAGTQSIVTDQSRFVASFFVLKSFHTVTRKWKVKCLKRGVFEIEHVSLVACDLFGNHNQSKGVDIHTRIVVLPNPVELEEIDLTAKHMIGDVLVTRHLIADPFYINGIREYSERDPMNKISWLATAKEKRLMVYQNEYTIGQSVAVILNMQSQEFERNHVINKQRIENCIKVCASCFYQTIKSGTPIQLFSNVSLDDSKTSVETKANWGLNHINELLHTLAHLPLTNNEDFHLFLNQIEQKISHTDIIIVTCYINDEILAFASNHDFVKILVVGYVDINLVPDGVIVYPLLELFESKNNTYES